MTQNIVAAGSTYRIYDQSVKVYTSLPPNTYKVSFSPLSGFSLVQVNDLESGSERVYGNINARVRKVLATYQRVERSLGVLASGDKGMGKTMLLRSLASAAKDELGLPVIIADTNYEGLAGFIDSLGECVVVFDEFEKTFRAYPDDQQVPFLSLFDGMSAVKRMYVVTINEIEHVNNYLVNRPSRFHYHFRFNYPGPDAISEYLTDKGIAKDQIGKVISFADQIHINYDHLRAIAFELSDGADFDDIITDLNIKRFEYSLYDLTLVFEKGTVSTIGNFNLGSRGRQRFGSDEHELYGYIDTRRIVNTASGLHVPTEAVDMDMDEDAVEKYGKLVGFSMMIDHNTNRVDF